MSTSREMFCAAIADFPAHVQASAIEEYDRRRYQERLVEAVTLYSDLCEGSSEDSSECSSEDSQAPGYGGTDGGSDCPREVGSSDSSSEGSSHTRPEKFTEGARWLRRLP